MSRVSFGSRIDPADQLRAERKRCMDILKDVPGETLEERVKTLTSYYQSLQNMYSELQEQLELEWSVNATK